jgi:hypothetical protein
MNTKVMTTSFLITMISVSPAALGGPHEADLDLQKIIHDLGVSQNFAQIMKDIHAIAASPRKSAKLLIEELHVIPDDAEAEKQESSTMAHVIWTFDALRYITGGKEFCSPSKHKFLATDEEINRAYWLKFAYGKCLTFFAIWPSRGRIYVAPRDSQARIIDMWRHWYKFDTKNYSFRPLVNPQPQDWLWN